MINLIEVYDIGNDELIYTIFTDEATGLTHCVSEDGEQQDTRSLEQILTSIILSYMHRGYGMSPKFASREFSKSDPAEIVEVEFAESVAFECTGSKTFLEIITDKFVKLDALLHKEKLLTRFPDEYKTTNAHEIKHGIEELRRIFSEETLDEFVLNDTTAELYFKITSEDTAPIIEEFSYHQDVYISEVLENTDVTGPEFVLKLYNYPKIMERLNNFGKKPIEINDPEIDCDLKELLGEYSSIATFIKQIADQKNEKQFGEHAEECLSLLEDYEAHHNERRQNAIEINVKVCPDYPDHIPNDFLHSEPGIRIENDIYRWWWEELESYLKYDFEHKEWIDSVLSAGRSGGWCQILLTSSSDFDEVDTTEQYWRTPEDVSHDLEIYDELDELYPVLKALVEHIENSRDYFEKEGFKEQYIQEYEYYKEENREDTRTA